MMLVRNMHATQEETSNWKKKDPWRNGWKALFGIELVIRLEQ